MSVQYATHHRFTVDEFERIAEAGVFPEEARLLRRNVVIVSRNPVAGQYMDVREHGAGEGWRSAALGSGEVRAADILGPER